MLVSRCCSLFFGVDMKKLYYYYWITVWHHQGTPLVPSGSALCWSFVSHLSALIRQLTIKICFGKLVLNHYLILPWVSCCQRFTPITFAVGIYPLFPLNLKYNQERNPVIPIMLGVQCCSCVRIKLDRYQLSALGVIDSKWKFIGSSLSLFSVLCNLGFPTIYKQGGVWEVKQAKLQDVLWSPSCAYQGALLRVVSDSKCFLCQMIYSQVK